MAWKMKVILWEEGEAVATNDTAARAPASDTCRPAEGTTPPDCGGWQNQPKDLP